MIHVISRGSIDSRDWCLRCDIVLLTMEMGKWMLVFVPCAVCVVIICVCILCFVPIVPFADFDYNTVPNISCKLVKYGSCYEQFDLGSNVKLSICQSNGLVVDIRRFLNKKATIKGIQFSTKVWKVLNERIPLINRCLNDV